MKNKIFAVLAAVFAIAVFSATVYANDNITVRISGEPVVFEGQQPAIVDGRTLVPVRGVFEQLGFTVGWDDDLRQATLTSDDHVVVITINSATFSTNGEDHALDVPAQIIGGSTMLPLRAVLESVGYHLDWDEVARAVLITSAPLDAEVETEADPEAEADPGTEAEPETDMETLPPTAGASERIFDFQYVDATTRQAFFGLDSTGVDWGISAAASVRLFISQPDGGNIQLEGKAYRENGTFRILNFPYGRHDVQVYLPVPPGDWAGASVAIRESGANDNVSVGTLVPGAGAYFVWTGTIGEDALGLFIRMQS